VTLEWRDGVTSLETLRRDSARHEPLNSAVASGTSTSSFYAPNQYAALKRTNDSVVEPAGAEAYVGQWPIVDKIVDACSVRHES